MQAYWLASVSAIVHRLELAAVDSDAGLVEQAELAANLDEPRTHLLDRGAVALAEIGDGLCPSSSP